MAALVTFTGMPFANSAPFGSTANPATGGVVVANIGSEIYDITAKETWVDFTVTLSGSYPAGGDPLDFTLASQVPPGAPPSGADIGPWAPQEVRIFEAPQVGTDPLGFRFTYLYGPASTTAAPTQAGGTLYIAGTGVASTDGDTQITAGLYSATTPSLNNAVLRGVARFARQ